MLATTEAEALSRTEFREALLGAIEGLRAEDTRLHRLLMARRCSPELIRRYALATVRSADLFCATLAEMAAKAPDAEARLVLLENLLEEEGMFIQPAHGMVHRPEASHPALARRFAAAVGAEGDGLMARHAMGPCRTMLAKGEWVEAVAHLLIGQELLFAETAPAMARALEASGLATRDARHATSAGRALLARGEWVEAVAHLLLGQELTFADTAVPLARALEANGLTSYDVAFFWVHETVDREHGEQALEMVLRHAHGYAQQQRCIAEARAGALAWCEAHGGLVG